MKLNKYTFKCGKLKGYIVAEDKQDALGYAKKHLEENKIVYKESSIVINRIKFEVNLLFFRFYYTE